MKYKGFHYLGKIYVWKQSELYRLPFHSGLRCYGVKKCAKWKDGAILGNGVKKSASQLEAMTETLELDFEFQEHSDTPFKKKNVNK